MALPDTSNVNPCEKPTTESHKHEKKEKPPTKVIVRRLPPSITQESFITQVAPLPDYDYMYTVRGDMSLGENAFSRVYINFVNSDDVYIFKEKFDNYVFVDNKGHEYSAVVEFASFQKIPKKRGKPRPDPKVGSIESDPLYLEFVESLKQQPNQEEKPEFSYQPGSDNKNDTSTPLLDYLKQRKLDRLKSREEKREERRRKEIERKKMRDEERKKRFDEKSPVKPVTIKSNHPSSKADANTTEKSSDKSELKTREADEKSEKLEEKSDKYGDKHSSGSHKSKDRKYDDYRYSNVKTKPKYTTKSEKYESYEKKDYKNRKEECKDRDRRGRNFDDYKKETDTKQYPKKVKKYSERREERKIEAKKAEQKRELTTIKGSDSKEFQQREKETEQEHTKSKSLKSESSSFDRSNSEDGRTNAGTKEDVPREAGKENDGKDEYTNDDQDKDKFKNKENDPRAQRRIRNKDRPTMAIYQPGMLSKRRQVDDDKDPKETTPVKEQ